MGCFGSAFRAACALALVAPLLAAPVFAQQNAPALADARPALIPTESFAARNAYSQIKLAPDGAHIAVVAPHGKGNILSVLDSVQRKPVASAIVDGKLDLGWVRWAGPHRLLYSASQVRAIEGIGEVRVTRMFMLDIASNKSAMVGPKKMTSLGDDLLWTAPDGSAILMALRESWYHYPSVYRISLDNPAADGVLVQKEMDEIFDWYADDAGVVRMGLGLTPNKKIKIVYRSNAGEKFRTIAKVGPDDEDKFWDIERIISGTDEGYVLKEGDDGRVALRKINFATREEIETVWRNDEWDVEGAWLDDGGKPLAVSYTDDRERVVWLDPAYARLQARLEKALGEKQVGIVQWSTDRKTMIVSAAAADDPGAYYLYTAGDQRLDMFAQNRPAIDFRTLATPKPVDIAARDGTKLRAYLTLPRGREPKGLPLVIMPHGGPYGIRDSLRYDDQVQLLANRGYAVLQPNFRGSGGYGTKFAELGEGQIGRAMQDDLDDAMDWAVAQGIADKARVCVVGGSYGGYAAMWAVIRNPERYRCAASFAGVTDWKKQLFYDRDFFASKKKRRVWRTTVQGDKEFDLDSVSPARNADRLTRPLLLVHGKEDSVVPFSQFTLMANAAERAGKPIEQLVLDDAGHNFGEAADEQKWYDTLLGFLAKHNPAD